MTDDLRELYQDLILDHSKHPRNFRSIEKADREALGNNPLCGDKITLHVSLNKDGAISDAAFQGCGCAISMASASMMTEMIKGKTPEEAEHVFEYMHAACTGQEADASGLDEDTVDRIGALSGVRDYPVRVKCATLAWHTLQAALKDDKKASTE